MTFLLKVNETVLKTLIVFLFFLFTSQKGVPELVLKDQKDIALEITVTNSPSDLRNPTKDGDDAHEAKLIATFPDTLTYSAYRELRAFPVSSFRDQLGGNKQTSWGRYLYGDLVCFSVTGETIELCCQPERLSSGLRAGEPL